MGRTFEFSTKYLPTIQPDSVFVEIGSDRGEGSTVWLSKLAKENQTLLHTVDITEHAKNSIDTQRFDITDSVEFHVQPGAAWAKNYGTTIGKPISLLYLDNFDWIWDAYKIEPWIQDQIHDYEKFGINMTNENCQQEHFAQMMYLYPWLTDNCLVLLDDTYLHNQVWTGKCGPVVVWLKHQGFKIIEATTACEVALIRG